MTDLDHLEHELRLLRDELRDVEETLRKLIYDLSQQKQEGERKQAAVGVALIDEYAPANADDPA